MVLWWYMRRQQYAVVALNTLATHGADEDLKRSRASASASAESDTR